MFLLLMAKRKRHKLIQLSVKSIKNIRHKIKPKGILKAKGKYRSGNKVNLHLIIPIIIPLQFHQ